MRWSDLVELVRPHHPDDGVICAMCFRIWPWEEMEPVSDEPGKRWDVCMDCAARERQLYGVHY